MVGSYYEDNATQLCSTNVCQAVFSQIPAEGGRVLVTNIACGITINDGELSQLLLGIGLANPRKEFLSFEPQLLGVGTKSYAVNEEIKFLFLPGQRPRVIAVAGTANSLGVGCRIVGTRPAP